MPSEQETTGAFIIQKQKHLQEFSDSDLRFYGATIVSGQCGRLLGKMRGLEVIHNMEKIELFAADVGAYDKIARENILNELEKKGTIDIYRENGKIRKIEERMQTEEEILRVTGEVWDELAPSEEEKVSLDVTRFCTTLPRIETELMGHLGAIGYKDNPSRTGLALTTKFRITSRIPEIPGLKEPVFHTPLYCSYNISKIVNQLRSIEDPVRQQIEALLNTIGTSQATSKSLIRIPNTESSILQNLGIIDVTKVETSQGRQEEFLFTPSMWGPFGTSLLPDEQEHVRAMLSCVQFGRLYPTEIDGQRFKIKYPSLYLNALIRRGKVGPATPIGTDYVILEREGIVELKPCSSKSGQFEMVLVKRDVAERAKRILERKVDIGLDGESNMEPLCQTGEFVNPIQARLQKQAKMKEHTGRSESLNKEILRVLRREK